MKCQPINDVFTACGQPVELLTDGGIISGETTFNYSGHNTNIIMIKFTYNDMLYTMPFSRKTGKLYGTKLPFNIILNTKTM